MRKIKKLLTLMVSVAVMALGIGNTTYACEADNAPRTCSAASSDTIYGTATECDYYLPLNTDSSEQYFLFNNGGDRLNADGSFTFSYSMAMPGQNFKPVKSTIRVYATATSSNS